MNRSQNKMLCVCTEVRSARKSSRTLEKRLKDTEKNLKYWARQQKELKQLSKQLRRECGF